MLNIYGKINFFKRLADTCRSFFVQKNFNLLIFHKTGCPDCQQVVRQVNQTIKQGQADHYVIVDTKDSKLYQKYNVIEVPTVIHLRGGQEVARYSGENNPQRLTKVIKAIKE